MFGISIDDEPDAPVGTPEIRRTVAIHWNWTTEYTQGEIATALGVKERTVRKYVEEPPDDDVQEMMDGVEAKVRLVAVSELKQQLKKAGSRSRSAEKPVKIYENDEGEVEVNEIELDGGVKKIPKVQDIQLLPDEKARYYAREEAREIIDQLVDLVGAAEPEQHEHEHSGSLDLWKDSAQETTE